MSTEAESLPSIFDDGDLYDLVGADLPYGLDFYVGLARQAAGPVLDIACGTGRILLPSLQAGVDIEGLTCSSQCSVGCGTRQRRWASHRGCTGRT
jgi:hypothetical protein